MIKTSYNKFGFLSKVVNTTGKKPSLYMAQPVTGESGKVVKSAWVAYPMKNPNKGSMYKRSGNAEEWMMKLAKQGHRQVKFLD
jgi:hypothetical protein